MTAPIALLEARLAAAEAKIVLFEGMINTSRRIVAARQFKAENDTPSPQIIKCGDYGEICLGSEGCWQVLDRLNVAVDHTGDTLETTLRTTVVPAGRMGKNGFLRVTSMWRSAPGAKVSLYWGGVLLADRFGYYTHASVYALNCSAPHHIWNEGATNVQRSRNSAMLLYSHLAANATPLVHAKDTTADVDIYFRIQNANAAHTSSLYMVLVELYNGNG